MPRVRRSWCLGEVGVDDTLGVTLSVFGSAAEKPVAGVTAVAGVTTVAGVATVAGVTAVAGVATTVAGVASVAGVTTSVAGVATVSACADMIINELLDGILHGLDSSGSEARAGVLNDDIDAIPVAIIVALNDNMVDTRALRRERHGDVDEVAVGAALDGGGLSGSDAAVHRSIDAQHSGVNSCEAGAGVGRGDADDGGVLRTGTVENGLVASSVNVVRLVLHAFTSKNEKRFSHRMRAGRFSSSSKH